MIPLIVILGPTSSGKTALSLYLAKKFKGEIVSADSRQVYKGLDIGTGKATKKELRSVPHSMINWKPPGKTITLAEYKKDADKNIADIWKRGNVPFLVGGTPLYIQAVIDNYQIPSVPPNQTLRKRLEKLGAQEMFKLLSKLDPDCARALDRKNTRRIVRALEVCIMTRKPFSKQNKKGKQLYRTLCLGLTLERGELYKKIDERLNSRIRKGLVKEVENLLKSGISHEWLSSLGLEYRHTAQFLLHFNNKNTARRNEYIKKLSFAIHDFARRQLVWFRRDARIYWLKPQDKKIASQLVRDFLFKYLPD